MPRPLPRNLAIVLAALSLFVMSCRKDQPKPTWDIDVVAPLARMSLTIGDLVPDSLLDTDANGDVGILSTLHLFSLSLDTILAIPDTSLLYAYALPFPGPVSFPPGSTFNTNDDVTRFDLQDLHLTKLTVRSGRVDIAISNMMNGNIIGNFALPGATLGGSALELQLALPPGTPSSPSLTTTTRELNGYKFDLRGPDLNATNALATHLWYANSPDGNAVSITNMDSLLAWVTYHDIIPEFASGSFGTREMEVEPATAELELFKHITGTLDLAQVDARLIIRNGLGVDAQARIHHIRSINTRTGTTVDLSAPLTSNPLNINRAVDLGSGFIPAYNAFAVGQGNSNIEQFLENLPDQIGYALDLTINPLGDISNGHDFLYHDSKVTADLEVEIPLRLIATNLTLAKLVDIDLPGTAEAHAWNSGVLHLFAENGFPFSAAIQLEVVNASGESMALLDPGGTVPAGVLDGNGIVVQPGAARIDFGIGPDNMNLLHQSGQLRVKAVFNTADQSNHVQIKDDYRMDLQLTMDANWVVNGNE